MGRNNSASSCNNREDSEAPLPVLPPRPPPDSPRGRWTKTLGVCGAEQLILVFMVKRATDVGY